MKPQLKIFKKTVRDFYRTGKRDLPWRTTRNPYHIMVSEIMLQQTQVDRVIGFYHRWLKLFPTTKALARAPLKQVLVAWQGLGYNRRGVNLKRAAEIIEKKFNGKIPATTEELLSLPGIGPYTASAVLAFAFNIPSVLIETNIRSVYIHHFFPRSKKIHDSKLLPLIEQTLDRKNPREWYAALMDYGSHLKKTSGNKSRQSKHYTRQSIFKGSTREERSKILKAVLESSHNLKTIRKRTALPLVTFKKHLNTMTREGIVSLKKGIISIAP